MNIIIISTSEQTGGAAIAANRLMHALNKTGKVEARMLVRDKNSDDASVSTIPQGAANRLRFAWERGVIFAANHLSKRNLFHVSVANTGYDITRTEEFKKADIIHIHWTQQGMLSLHDMDKIFKSGKPVVWTMHDMWACTGICHHSESCDKYSEHCFDCPYLKGHRKRDLAYRTFDRKRKIYSDAGFSIVACSHWLESCAQRSALLKGKQVFCIPNPIDTGLFSPMDKSMARESLGLPKDKRLVLFASQKVTDKRKGIDYLIEAATILKKKGSDLELVIMGRDSEQIQAMLPYPCHSMGYVSFAEKSALIYNACDLFVTPSLMENLPNTIMESMACGTPCVGFNVGGIPEMIDHKINGYVAVYKSPEDLAEGIAWCLDNPDYGHLSDSARRKVLSNYSEQTVTEQFIKLYNKSL